MLDMAAARVILQLFRVRTTDGVSGMLQQKMKEILQKEDDLQEIVQQPGSTKLETSYPFPQKLSVACPCLVTRLVGKDSLSEDQKCTLEVAKIIREVPY